MAKINDYALMIRGHHSGKLGQIVEKYPIESNKGSRMHYDVFLDVGFLVENVTKDFFTASKYRDKLINNIHYKR